MCAAGPGRGLLRHAFAELRALAPTPLSAAEVRAALRAERIRTWRYVDERAVLRRHFSYDTIDDVICVMNSVARFALAIDHHPDWWHHLNHLCLELSTHSLRAVSDKDLYLAKYVNMVGRRVSKFDKGNFERLVEVREAEFAAWPPAGPWRAAPELRPVS